MIEFLQGAGGAALFTGLFAIVQWLLKRKAQKADKLEDRGYINCNARGEELKTLHTEVEVLKEALGVQFYNEIKRKAKEFKAKSYITFEEYEDIQRDYRMYHSKDKLNMNGFLKGIMEEIERLEKRVS